MTTLLRRANIFPTVSAFLIFFPGLAAAVIPFTPENTVDVSSAIVQAVVPVAGGFYRMYASSGGFTVISATSSNQASWALEGGVRLSTAPNSVDSASITACGVLPATAPAANMRMYYTAISSVGLYGIVSATSTDGLAWGKESGIRIRRNGGSAFLDSPRPLAVNANLIRLFYVADGAGGNTPANYRIFSASSADGINFSDEGAVLAADVAYQVSVTTLTDGRTRIYYSAPVAGQSTASVILSAISNNGLVFAKEADFRLSTSAAAAALASPVVVRSTENFRWRMFLSYTPSGTGIPYVSSALTRTPKPVSLNPSSVLKNQSNVPFTLTGEIFSPAPGVTFTIGSDTITAGSVVRVDDTSITGIMTPLNRTVGKWDVVATNSDGASGTLFQGLFIDVPPGTVSILDNLFRPLKGGFASITITTFEDGQLTSKVYTSEGGLVRVLFDGPMAAGNKVITWDGKTSLGHTVASGVYLLKTTGAKLNRVDKIVVIK